MRLVFNVGLCVHETSHRRSIGPYFDGYELSVPSILTCSVKNRRQNQWRVTDANTTILNVFL